MTVFTPLYPSHHVGIGNPHDEGKESEADMVCAEGGTHDFRIGREPTGLDRVLCIACFPCYGIGSWCLPEGSSLANPVFDKLCRSKFRNELEKKGKGTCTKCGLSERDAVDLSSAGPDVQNGYYSNSMTMPPDSAAGVSPHPLQSSTNGSPMKQDHSE